MLFDAAGGDIPLTVRSIQQQGGVILVAALCPPLVFLCMCIVGFFVFSLLRYFSKMVLGDVFHKHPVVLSFTVSLLSSPCRSLSTPTGPPAPPRRCWSWWRCCCFRCRCLSVFGSRCVGFALRCCWSRSCVIAPGRRACFSHAQFRSTGCVLVPARV